MDLNTVDADRSCQQDDTTLREKALSLKWRGNLLSWQHYFVCLPHCIARGS